MEPGRRSTTEAADHGCVVKMRGEPASSSGVEEVQWRCGGSWVLRSCEVVVVDETPQVETIGELRQTADLAPLPRMSLAGQIGHETGVRWGGLWPPGE